MNIRKITKTDCKEYEELRNIWTIVFEDEPAEVDSLYDRLNATGYILEDDGIIKSCLTVYNAGSHRDTTVEVIYAVCTLPEFRNHGYASEVIKYAKHDIESNDHIAITCPANQDLVSFYSKLGFMASLMARKRSVIPDEDVPAVTVRRINPRQYGKYRETFLKDINHIVLSDALLEQAQEYSINGSGMLLINNGDAICILDRGTEDEMFISELLVNPLLQERSLEIIFEIAAGLAGLFETNKAVFRTTTYAVYSDINGDYLSEGSYIQAMSGNGELEEGYYGLPME